MIPKTVLRQMTQELLDRTKQLKVRLEEMSDKEYAEKGGEVTRDLKNHLVELQGIYDLYDKYHGGII